jgi:hypothetical protein
MLMDYICGPEWDKRIVTFNHKPNSGILMSGGVDSFVLYNLFETPKPKIFHIDLITGSDDINVVKKLTNRDDIVIVKDFPWVKNSKLTRFEKIVKNVLKNYKVDELYLASNRVPPIDCFPEFNTKRKPPRPWLPNHPIIKLPFLTLYKYHVIDLANRLRIDISETQSCLEWKNGHCGKCWQCREKKWAYQQLGLKG